MSINNDDSNKAFDAKTMIAIVLMVVVITAGMAIQNYFWPKPGLPVETPQSQAPVTRILLKHKPASGFLFFWLVNPIPTTIITQAVKPFFTRLTGVPAGLLFLKKEK